MRKAIAAVCATGYFLGVIICADSFWHDGFIGNYAIVWILPFLVQLLCYAILLFKKAYSYKIAVFATVLGFVLSIPVIVLSIPNIFNWFLLIAVLSALSLVGLCMKRR